MPVEEVAQTAPQLSQHSDWRQHKLDQQVRSPRGGQRRVWWEDIEREPSPSAEAHHGTEAESQTAAAGPFPRLAAQARVQQPALTDTLG